MKTQSIDTSPDAERVLIQMIRKAPITKRFHIVQSLTASMFEGGRLYEQDLHPQASRQETRLLFTQRQYGKTLVDQLRQALHAYDIQTADHPDYRKALYPLIEAFEYLDIPYALSGSLVSSLYGLQRATLQLDLIADLRQEHCEYLCEQLVSQYFFSEEEVKFALAQIIPFIRLIHLKSLLKVVVTLPDNLQLLQRVWQIPLVEGERAIAVLAPEQVILQLLHAFKKGDERDDDLWYDLLAVVKVQRTDLDISFMMQEAAVLNVTELLERALDHAGLTNA